MDESPPSGSQEKLNAFLKSPLVVLFAGFALTGICVPYISARIAESNWKKDKRFELFKSNIAKHEALLTDLTTIVGARTFRTQRVVWATDAEADPAAESWPLDDQKKKNLEAFWDDYYKSVVEWNLNYRNYAAKIRLLAGDQVAEQFFAAGTNGARVSKTDTVCGSFEETHKLVAELRKSALSGQIDRKKHDDAQQKVDRLYDKVDAFVRTLYTVLGEKEKSEDPLAPESGRKTN